MTTTERSTDPHHDADGRPVEVDWRRVFTPELAERYRRDGVVFVPQLIHPEWLELIAAGIARIMRSESSYKAVFFPGEDGEFVDTVRNFDVTPELQRLLYDSPIADMMSALLGSERIWLLFDHVFVKSSGHAERTPWHQDLPYWPIEGRQVASFWITLDPIPAEECLEFVRGSHHGTMYDGFDPRRASEDPTLPFYGGDVLPRLPDIQSERDRWDIVSFDIAPGDVVILHPGVLHGGGQTSEGRRRRTLSVRCFGEDERYAERPGRTVPRTPGLPLSLRPGDPLRSPYYHRLRPLPPGQRPEDWH